MKNITRVLLAEDHSVFREAVASLIAGVAGFEVVGAVDSGTAALTAVAELMPDMLVLDLHLPDISGLDVLRRLRAAGTNLAILVLTSSDSDHTVRQAIALGARGYFVKSGGADALIAALCAVAQGRRYLSPEATEQLAEHLNSEELSGREIEILRLASFGLTNRQIGDELGISERTVKFHFKTVFQKLNTSDRTAAVVVALRRGMLNL